MKRVLIFTLCSVFLASAYQPHGYSFEVPTKEWEDCEIADTILEKITKTKIETDASWEYLKTIIEPNYDLLGQIGPLIIIIEENELAIAESYKNAVLLQTSTSSQAIELLSSVHETSDFEIDSAYKMLQTAMTELKDTYTYEERAKLIEEIKSILNNLLALHESKIEKVKEEVKNNYTVELPGLKNELEIAISLCANNKLYRGEFDLYAPLVSTFEIYSTQQIDTDISDDVLISPPAKISNGDKIGLILPSGAECTFIFDATIPEEYKSSEYAIDFIISGVEIKIGYDSFTVEGYTPETKLDIDSQRGLFHVEISKNGNLGVLYNGQYSSYELESYGFDGQLEIKAQEESPIKVSQLLFKYQFTDFSYGKTDQDCVVEYSRWIQSPVTCGIGMEYRYIKSVIRMQSGNGKPCPSDETKLYQHPVCPLSLPGSYTFEEIKKAMEVDTQEPFVVEGIYSSSHIKIYFASEIELRAAILEFTLTQCSYDPSTNLAGCPSYSSSTYNFSVVNRENEYHKDKITGLSNVLSIEVPGLLIHDMTIKTSSMEPSCSLNCLNFFYDNGVCEAACYNSACSFDGQDCVDKSCSDKCSLNSINDGICDNDCYTPECNYDGDDCKCRKTGCNTALLGDNQCDVDCNNPECNFDQNDCLCANTGCDTNSLGNSYCDELCNNQACGFDESDCTCVEKGCPNGWFNNAVCEKECQIPECIHIDPDCTHECDIGCKSHQINDGVCDPECEKSEKCLWDGVDCFYSDPDCVEGCSKALRENGVCDIICMVAECGYDDGDCSDCQLNGCPPGWDLDSSCNQECNIPSCHYDNGYCPNCSPTCTPDKLENGICDFDCFVEGCGWDKEDCGDMCSYKCLQSMLTNGVCDPDCQSEECGYDWQDCGFCASGCKNELLGDKTCNEACNNKSCGFDLGDCPLEQCSPGCTDLNKGNGICDTECFNEACGWDEGDCKEYCDIGCKLTMLGDGICQRSCLNQLCNYDQDDCIDDRCSLGCYESWLGDKKCDSECENINCKFDNGDCLKPDECAPGCTKEMINNTRCNDSCNNSLCDYDGLDCHMPCAENCTVEMQFDDICQQECNVSACSYDNHSCENSTNCAVGCKPNMVGNQRCDKNCNVEACAFDAGDCLPCDCPIDYLGDGFCDMICFNALCRYDKGDCDENK